jgi:hypothetical protein
MARDDVRHAIDLVAHATHELLASLPAPRSAPLGPPGRWRSVDLDEI